MNRYPIIQHLISVVPKGGHGFIRRDCYSAFDEILVKVHHFDHGHLQGTLSHREHPPEIELERQLLLAQYWTGRTWKRMGERQTSQWKSLGEGATIGEPDLVTSLLEIVRGLNDGGVLFRLKNTI